jgi:hypothetical protein
MSKWIIETIIRYLEVSNTGSLRLAWLDVGYSDRDKGWRLWDPTSHKVIINGDV